MGVIGLRVSGASGPLTVQAIAGTNVVILGVDHDRDLMAGVSRQPHQGFFSRALTNNTGAVL
jgi:hypothetical protein